MGGFVKKYLRIDEVADMFGVHPKTVASWWRSEKTCLEAWRGPIGSRGIKFTSESVSAFEQQGKTKPQDLDE